MGAAELGCREGAFGSTFPTVNYIAWLWGKVTNADDPEHRFSVSGVE